MSEAIEIPKSQPLENSQEDESIHALSPDANFNSNVRVALTKSYSNDGPKEGEYYIPYETLKSLTFNNICEPGSSKAASYPPVKKLNPFMKKRILVTGGAGFVGSHLVDRLMLSGRIPPFFFSFLHQCLMCVDLIALVTNPRDLRPRCNLP